MPIVDIDGYGLVDVPDGMSPDAIVGAIRQIDKRFDADVRRSQKGLPKRRDIASELSGEKFRRFQEQQEIDASKMDVLAPGEEAPSSMSAFEADAARHGGRSVVGRATGLLGNLNVMPAIGPVGAILAPFMPSETLENTTGIGAGDDSGAKQMASRSIDIARSPLTMVDELYREGNEGTTGAARVIGAARQAARSAVSRAVDPYGTGIMEMAAPAMGRASRDLGDVASGLRMRGPLESRMATSVREAATGPTPAIDLAYMTVKGVAENAPQYLVGGLIMKGLMAAGLGEGVASFLAPIISTAPLEAQSALEEYAQQELDPEKRRLAAAGVGAVNGLIETVGDTALLQSMFGSKGPGALPIGAAIKFAIAQIVEQMARNTGEEVSQELGTIAGGVAAGGRMPTADEVRDRGMTAGFIGLTSSGAMTTAMAGPQAAGSVAASRELLDDERLDSNSRNIANLTAAGLNPNIAPNEAGKKPVTPTVERGIPAVKPNAPEGMADFRNRMWNLPGAQREEATPEPAAEPAATAPAPSTAPNDTSSPPASPPASNAERAMGWLASGNPVPVAWASRVGLPQPPGTVLSQDGNWYVFPSDRRATPGATPAPVTAPYGTVDEAPSSATSSVNPQVPNIEIQATDAGLYQAPEGGPAMSLVDWIIGDANRKSLAESGLSEPPPETIGETTPVDQLVRKGQSARRRASVLSGMIREEEKGGDVYEGQVQEQETEVEQPSFPRDPNQFPAPTIERVGEPELESKWSREISAERSANQASQWLDLSVDIATGRQIWKTSPVMMVDAPTGNPLAASIPIRDAVKRIGTFGYEKVEGKDGKTKMVRPTGKQAPRARIVARDMETGDVVVFPAWFLDVNKDERSLPDSEKVYGVRVYNPNNPGSSIELRGLLTKIRTSQNKPRYVPIAVYPQLRERATTKIERFSGAQGDAIVARLPEMVGEGRIIGRGRTKGKAAAGAHVVTNMGERGGLHVSSTGGTSAIERHLNERFEDLTNITPDSGQTMSGDPTIGRQTSSGEEHEAQSDNRLRIVASEIVGSLKLKPGQTISSDQWADIADQSLARLAKSNAIENKARYLKQWYVDVIESANQKATQHRRITKEESWSMLMHHLGDEMASMHAAGTLGLDQEIPDSVLHSPASVEGAARSAEALAKLAAREGMIPQHLRGNEWRDGVGVIYHSTKSSAPAPSGRISRGLYGFTVPSLTFWRSAEQSDSGGSPVIYKIIANPHELGTSPDLFVKPGSTLVEVPSGRSISTVDGVSVPIVTLITDGAIRSSGSIDDFLSPPKQNVSASGQLDTESILYGITPANDQEAGVIRLIASRLGGATTYVQPDAEFDLIPSNRGRVAYYDPRNHRIVVRQSAGVSSQPYLHEAVHAATVRGLVEDHEFRAEIEKLQAEARALLGVGTYGTQAGLSKTSNLAEFVAEALSNPEFQRALNDAQAKGKRSIWQRFVDAVMRLLGIDRANRTIVERVMLATQASQMDGGSVQNLDPLAMRYRDQRAVQSALQNPAAQDASSQLAIERQASAQADLAEAALVPFATRASSLSVGTPHERGVGRIFEKISKWLPDQANALRATYRMALEPLPDIASRIASLPEDQRDEALKPYQQAAVDVLDLRHEIRVKRERNEARIALLRDKMDEFIQKKLPKKRSAELKAAYLDAAADSEVNRYAQYLKARQKTDRNLTEHEQSIHMAAVNRLADVRRTVGGPANQIAKALDLIASQMTMQELDAIQTLPDLEEQIFVRGILNTPSARQYGVGQNVSDFLANADGSGAIANMPNALEVLKRLRRLHENTVQYDQEVDDFEAWWDSVVKKGTGPITKPTVSQFVTSILRLDRQRRDAVAMIREMSQEFDKLDRELRARIEYRALIDEVMASPQYNRQLEGAQSIAGAMGFIESGRKAQLFGSQDDSVLPYQEHLVGDQLFKIRWDLETGFEEDNWREVGRMVDAIQHELATNQSIDPIQIAGYRNLLRNAENYYRMHGGTTQAGATQTGSLDIVNRLTEALPLVKLLKTRGDITRKLPGRIMQDLTRSQQAVNAVSLALRGVSNHPVYGSKRQAEAEAQAIKSHTGMTPHQWHLEVLEPLLAESQRFDRRNPEAGSANEYGHTYTSQDVKSAKLQSQFVEAAIRVIEGPASRSGVVASNPVLIEDKDAALARKAAATGPMPMPRGFRRGSVRDPESVDYLDNAWSMASKPEDADAKLSSRIALLESDQSFFERVARAYVWEQNPEFQKIGLLRQAMDSLSVDWHRRPASMPTTWADLVAEVTARHNEIQEQMATEDTEPNLLDDTEVEAAMISAIDGVFQAYRSSSNMAEQLAQLGLEEKDLEGLANKDVLVSIMSAQSSFTTPRGRMVGPSTFYRYGIPTTGQKAGVLAAAMNPFRMRELKLLKVALKALRDRSSEMERTITSIPYSKWAKDAKAGTEYADYHQLNRLINQLATAVETYESTMKGVASSLTNDSLLDAFLSADRSLLLASPTAAMSNVLSAVSLGSAIPSMMMGQTGRGFARAAENLVTAVPRLVLSAIAGTETGRFLRKHAPDLPWGLRHIVNKMQQAAEFHRLALESHIIAPRLSLRDQVAIAKEVGSISSEAPVLGPGRDPQSWRRTISRLVASNPYISYPLLGLFQVSQLADELGNTLAYQADDRNLRYYMAALYRIMQNRYDANGGGARGLAAIDPNNIDNAIKPEEFAGVSMSREDVRTAGQLFTSAGGIERAAYDYWMRAHSVPDEDRPSVPLFASPAIEADVRREVQMLTNLAADSNRPDITRNPTSMGGKTINTLFTFPGWTSGWLSTLGRYMQASTRRGSLASPSNLVRGLKTVAVLMLMLAMLGAPIPELRNLITRYIMNREPTSISLSTVLNDPTPSNAVRAMATAIASSVPYFGEYLADAAGAPTYRAAIGDITRMSRTFSMLGGLKDSLEYGLKTGDYGGMTAQTLRNVAPIGSVAWNRIPSIAQRNAVADAVRAARVAAGPLETTPMGGGSSGREPSEFSSLIRRATAAETAGDSVAADQFLKRAEEVKRREGVKNPRSAIMSAISTQSPDIKTFGRRLEKSEREALLGRMGRSARQSYVRVEDAVARLKSRSRAPARQKKQKAGPLTIKSPTIRPIKMPKISAQRPPGRGLRIGAAGSGGPLRLRMVDPFAKGRARASGMPRVSGLRLG